MLSYFDHKVIKTAFGTFLSIYLAQILGIKYGVTAGIVTIISIQATKKESIQIAIERVFASAIGLFISAVFFYFFGFTPIVFGAFVLIFMPICLKFNLFQGFLATVVLATHILAEKQISFMILLNEVEILALGAGVAIVLNLYMPDISKDLEKAHEDINNLMRTIFNYMGEDLITGSVFIDEDLTFKELKKQLNLARDLAFKDYNNSFFYGSRYWIELFHLKREQYKILVRMRKHFYKLFFSSEHTYIVSAFTKEVGESIGVNEIYKKALKDLEDIKEIFREMPLPQTRNEFENRAILYQFFSDIEEFLELKEDFRKFYALNGEKITKENK
ncbi:aromatic acid exporter family protein [Fusobacterium sp.]|uniref:aromatic acid exporter family protein n=1 Tax=Fusobacterium sp. TaxID=68766 RepID=UPI0026303747|nr:aromatic acid exporter family protein [Fusobacterium sp.]